MLISAIARIVRISTNRPWAVVALAALALVASVVYAATHFAINTDINKLISPGLDWRQRELEFRLMG